jgi:hypothetical protein
MAYYAPKLFSKYCEVLGALQEKVKSLQWTFNNSIFPTATINFGPQTVCFDHLDYGNWAVGWCDIVSLGTFDHTKGGHLILFDIKKVIEFPAGSHILIPSAVMRHGNTPIQKGETRMGFTQYASGGLFRWVENGFCTNADVQPEMKKLLDAAVPDRYKNLLGLYSKIDELGQDRHNVFGKYA